jgi:hypothetical protein
MKKFATVVCLSMFAAPVVLAADANTAPVAVKTKPSEAAPADAKNKPVDQAVILKNKSEFKMDAATRNPFWPIGYKPAGKVATGGSEQGEVPPGAFVVSSITLDGTAKFAIINGKPMSEGQQFGLQVGTQVYQVSVKRIEDGRVILGRRDEEIVVPLRRK